MTAATASHTVRFHQLERGTSDRVRNKRVNERTGKEVPYDKIVKGYATGEGEYVIVEPQELDEISPGRSKSIEIVGFAELDRIDPVYFDTTYYLQPRSESDGKTYAVLRDALGRAGRAGIATMSMRQKEYLVAVHTEEDVLVLHTLHWADEVRDPEETLDKLPSDVEPTAKERKMAEQLIDTMAIDFDPEDYHDHTQERVHELVRAKQSGESVAKAEEAPEATNVVDLTSALRRSVESARSGGSARSARSGRSGGRKRDSGLAELTKDELYRRAADAGIGGRSKMNRDELLHALDESGTEAA